MRCSASFLFADPHRAFDGSTSGQRQHASFPPPCATSAIEPEGQTGHDGRKMCPLVGFPRNRITSWRSRAPRPVTAHQLCRAVLGLDYLGIRTAALGRHGGPHAKHEPPPGVLSLASTSVASEPCGEHQKVCGDRNGLRDAVTAARLGESTIQLDTTPCHRVLVCGRIVRCIDAFSNGSVAAAARGEPVSAVSPTVVPYDLLWLSDATGVVCVLRLRPALGHGRTLLPSTRCLSGAWTRMPVSGVRDDTPGAASDMLSDVFGTADASGAAAPPTSATERTSVADLDSSPSMPQERHASNELDDDKGTEAIVNLDLECEDDYAFEVNDYVVCVGSLSFADVDLQTRNALQPYASDLRQATWTAAMSSSSSLSAFSADGTSFMGTGDDSGDVSCRTCGAGGRDDAIDENGAAASLQRRASPAQPPRQKFVLLPGSEVPLTLDAAREKLGLVGSLPSSAHYLTAAEAAHWGCSTSDPAAPSSTLSSMPASGLRDHNGERKLATSGDCGTSMTLLSGGPDMNAVPLMGIKGYPRLVLDTNECLFWWLAAAETHFRLRARAPGPVDAV
ncbi:hypothetical protein, conserved [Leishmania tarentolae]|uniref:Uncharacterized protein n=1 Tax=Leishmania tarentolae TaxID=5689 RepID=A0A640KQW1_LEITA|nr:hypothetical protein, conserved [Leishmania tarentolae]